MANLTITPVTHANFRAVMALELAPGQEGYIEPNSQSLAEVLYDPELTWHPFALMQAEVCVGFAMVGAEEADADWLHRLLPDTDLTQVIWLDRFMIGAAFQHQGLGGKLLEAVIALIHERWPHHVICLSYHEENQVARQFYRSHGFVDTGRADPSNGELIMTHA